MIVFLDAPNICQVEGPKKQFCNLPLALGLDHLGSADVHNPQSENNVLGIHGRIDFAAELQFEVGWTIGRSHHGAYHLQMTSHRYSSI